MELAAPASVPERALTSLGERARAFARMPPREKAALLRATLPALLAAAPAVAAAQSAMLNASPAAQRWWAISLSRMA